MSALVRFFNDESSAMAIGYGLIAALIAVGIIAVVTGFSPRKPPSPAG